ncbi:galactokinase [Caloramator sp. E03]|uniref:galactokinase n=1 Tax=Caloramator sp. E03 TaxID=2576307 RepID=UPI0011104720|nr:galactokinase [Caloramator sp. E03]QCX33916.1 galactokinase [Caloramator sp. E03]
MNIEHLKNKFYEYYGEKDNILCFFSPGRVNLIGEHIDYNGGYVFPGALTLGIYAVIRYRSDDIVNLKSLNAKETVTFKLDDIEYKKEDGWGNYPKGVIKYLLRDYSLKGCDILYFGDLPDGAGLSSSAAIEVLTAYMMLYPILKHDIDRVELSLMCQKVENNFIKVNCGIMDQFSVAMGKKNNAILLDCNTLKYEYVPFELKNYSLVIMNTNKKRELADSKYNERRTECEKSLEIIKNYKKVSNLCEAKIDDVYNCIKDETLIKRARHVISENERVVKAVEVLNKGDILSFGKLMNGSHKSLKEDYEVTGLHLDTIVEAAQNAKGCIGARMTGAGFGGCAIAIVESEYIEEFKDIVANHYKNKTGISPSFYTSVIGDGVKFLG